MNHIAQNKNKPLVAIDLFCGCGGMTEGLKQAGFKVLWGIDISDMPLEAYKCNHPDVLVWKKDIRDVNHQKLRKWLGLKKGELDLLAGCPPCQGFSSIRTKNGAHTITDVRNDLVAEYVKFVAEFRPKTVMLENVPGLKDNWRFTDFLMKLDDMGYKGEWAILNAADYGVPQRRRRLIYIGSRIKNIELKKAPSGKITVRDAIGLLPEPGDNNDPLHDFPEHRTEKIRTMIALIPQNGGSRSDLPNKYVLPCHKRTPDGFKDVYGRMSWDVPSPTITGGCASPSKGRFLHPQQNRCITLREAAILQGFPENYYFPAQTVTKEKLALMIGNALPPPFIRTHAREILNHIKNNSHGKNTETGNAF